MLLKFWPGPSVLLAVSAADPPPAAPSASSSSSSFFFFLSCQHHDRGEHGERPGVWRGAQGTRPEGNQGAAQRRRGVRWGQLLRRGLRQVCVCVCVQLLVVVLVIYRVIFLLRNKQEELVKVKTVRSSVLVWGCEPTGAPPRDISGGKCCQGVMWTGVCLHWDWIHVYSSGGGTHCNV